MVRDARAVHPMTDPRTIAIEAVTTVGRGCRKHRRRWAMQRLVGSDERGERWLAECRCGIVIATRWFIESPEPHSEWEWVRP